MRAREIHSRRLTWLISVGLALAVLAAYVPLWRAGFITYDDPEYVTANPHVQSGLTWDGVIWAITTGAASNWHPLTWISHMLDCQLYGLNPIGHHLTNVLFHLANSILLFLLLQRLTKETWPSAMVAALFALHPLHVESVAWVSERKDVLSALFWILSVWSYARWAEENRPRFYILSTVLFALGLMAKSMLVTLPFVLLLLDYWPLQRRQIPVSTRWREKKPYFILAAVSCAITFFAQLNGGAVKSLETVPLGLRLENVPVAYARYLGKTFWPAHLAIPYPMERWPILAVAGSAVLLLILTVVALARFRAQPWLAVGWLWFIVGLTPVIGLVQVGTQAMADRYFYIPSVGLFIAIVWAVREWSSRLNPRAPAILGGLAITICLVLTVRQAALWENSETLFLHSIQFNKNNYVAYDRLGRYEETKGRTNAAIAYFETAVSLQPQLTRPLDDLGRVLLAAGRTDEALARLRAAVSLDPDFADARYNLGYALLAKGQVGEALDQFQAQVNLDPANFRAQKNMATVLLQNGLAADSLPFLLKAVEIKPDDADANYMLGNALYRGGRGADAIRQYEKTIQLDPRHIQACNDLAWILASAGDPSIRNAAEAVELAQRADQLSGGTNPVVVGTLAAGYAEAGKLSEAIATEKRACQIALTQKNPALADILQKRLKLYEAGKHPREND